MLINIIAKRRKFKVFNEIERYLVIEIRNLLYVLNLLTLSGTTKQKTPNMVGKQAKSDQTLTSVAGYKWSQKSAIFGKVLEKGLT